MAGEVETPSFAALANLDATVRQRQDADPDESYTARLSQRGVAKIAQKLGEEAVETALAAAQYDAGQVPASDVASESADLLYHLLVLWARTGIDAETVMAELESRMSSHHKTGGG